MNTRSLLRCLWLAAWAVLAVGGLAAAVVDQSSARWAAERCLARIGADAGHQVGPLHEFSDAGGRLAWIFDLTPAGYVVVAADTALPPIMAFSLEADAWSGPAPANPLLTLLRSDLRMRLDHQAELPAAMLEERLQFWESHTDRRSAELAGTGFQQWPPAGTTPTGGWLATNWHQNAPYSNLCPTDPVAGGRSLAGCPAVAMAQIVNYHADTLGVQFDDGDDYYHNYASRNYWIDNDHAARGFPSWAELNALMSALQARYDTGAVLTDTDMAALTWACGAAARQVYTTSGSGTFGVSQAHDAWLRFGYAGVALLDAGDADLFPRLSQNMKDALPAHLAVVTPDWDAGHNVVVDGYNTDDLYHINFGWGGAYNGWYHLPDDLPYNLTVVEGVILDIAPPPVPGDLNQDGARDSQDLLILAHYLAGSLNQGEGGFTAPALRADLSGDGQVRAVDLVLMLWP